MKCGPFLISLMVHAALVGALMIAARPRDLPPRIAMASGTGESGGAGTAIVMSDPSDDAGVPSSDVSLPVPPRATEQAFAMSDDPETPNVRLASSFDDAPGRNGLSPAVLGDLDLPLAGVAMVAAGEMEVPRVARSSEPSLTAPGDNGDGVGVGDGAPRASTDNRLPAYPAEARRVGVEGVVVLRIEVRADGTVGEVGIDRSSGSPLLDRPAIERAREWTFAPATQDGHAIACQITYPVEFKLRRS